ncbi:MAG: biopolymer transporter ExbD [Cyanobacteria bacterium Co-bin8]|nr:biopolymer transporter ExbD [Cyanobacteria bacterium Co-bin8]
MKLDLLETSTEDVRLELVPLIDVIFCILTFFILAAVGLTQQQAIDLDLPAAQTGQPVPGTGQAIPDRLYVSIDAIGQVYLDQQPVTLDLLYDVLLQHQQAAPNGLIVLYASRDARYEDVVTVLDLLRSVGGDRVALATLPRDRGQPDGTQPGQPIQPGQPGQQEGDLFPLQPAPGSPLAPVDPNAPLSPFGEQQQPLNQPQFPTGDPLSPSNPEAQPSAPLAPEN